MQEGASKRTDEAIMPCPMELSLTGCVTPRWTTRRSE
jgi:hypothetical protein